MTDNTLKKIAESAQLNPKSIYKTLNEWDKKFLELAKKQQLKTKDEIFPRLNNSKPKSKPLVSCQAKTNQIKSKKLILTQNSILC